MGCANCNCVKGHEADCMILDYEYFVIKDNEEIVSGWEYRSDALEAALDHDDEEDVMVRSKRWCEIRGLGIEDTDTWI